VKRVLVARLDNVGDVLLTGPLVRAVARSGREVTFLCSPRARAAAELLPGVERILCFEAPWIAADPPPMTDATARHLVERVRAARIGEAVIATSFHQSPLPLALLLRTAGVPRIGAISEDYPGSLLDVRHTVPHDVHEVERNLSLAEACGFALGPDDPADLRIRAPGTRTPIPAPGYVVVHPGASVPARTWGAAGFTATVAALAARGRRVVVTGGPHERALTARVAGGATGVVDLGGRLDLPRLAAVISAADAIVVGNTGPAHLAAAVGTPVVSLFPPTVPVARWRPWGVPHRVLGDQAAPCRGCRARTCPVPGQPCLDGVTVAAVLAAVEDLARAADGAGSAEVVAR
jgi:ADP-heptose:LPS heptosyltransferase